MDAVSAGAGIVAFLGLALQSTKTIYQAAQDFKGAPQQIKALIFAVESLQVVLVQIQNCKLLSDPTTNLQNITEVTKRCSEDLLRYEKSLSKLQSSPGTINAKQIWKRLKSTLGEKELKQIWTEVNQHCTALVIQLQLLQSDTTVICQIQLTKLNDTSDKRMNHENEQASRLQQQSRDLAEIHGKVENVQSSLDDQLQTTLRMMTDKIENVPELSRQQNEDIRTLLGAIQAQLTGLSAEKVAQLPAHKPLKYDSGQIGSIELEDDESDLFHSLQNLSDLVAQKEGTVASEEADMIIDNLGSLLTAKGWRETYVSPSKAGKRRKRDSAELITNRDIKRLKGLVEASRKVDVNTHRQKSSFISSSKVIQTYKTKETATENFRLIVTLNERKLIPINADSNSSQDQTEEVQEAHS